MTANQERCKPIKGNAFFLYAMKPNQILLGRDCGWKLRGWVFKWQFLIACNLQHTTLTFVLDKIGVCHSEVSDWLFFPQILPQSKNRISDVNLSQPKQPNTNKKKPNFLSLSLSQELTIGAWNIGEKKRHGPCENERCTITLHFNYWHQALFVIHYQTT